MLGDWGVGHSARAPGRKSDHGELFDWVRLARDGIGIWPRPKPPRQEFIINPAAALADLVAIGYCASAQSRTAALAAFQRRFRQSCCDGWLDAETAARLSDVRDVFARSRAATRGAPHTSKADAACKPCKYLGLC